jgi:ribosomal protein S12
MRKQQQTNAKRRVRTLQKEMGALGPFMRGTVVVIGTRNKQPYFSLNKDRKTRLIYLGKKRERQARRLSAAYKKLLDIIEEMTMLNMDLLKNDALE